MKCTVELLIIKLLPSFMFQVSTESDGSSLDVEKKRRDKL